MGNAKKTDADQILEEGLDLYELIELVESNSQFLSDRQFTIMRLSTGWKAFYGAPILKQGEPGHLEGGCNSLNALPMLRSIYAALGNLLRHPNIIVPDGKGYILAEPMKKKSVAHLISVLRAAPCDIKHDHNIGLCRVPKRKRKKSTRKKKFHGMGSIYRVAGCKNWFLKFKINGKQCYLRTGTTDKVQARHILREERAKEIQLQLAT